MNYMDIREHEDLLRYILEHGKKYTPALFPDDLLRGQPGTCFDTCALLATGRKYRYVEGVVTVPNEGHWTLHAWLTDGVYAYDPTWVMYDQEKREVPLQCTYIGIEMPIEKVAAFMRATEYQGVLPNGWRSREHVAFLPGAYPIIKI